MSQATIQGLDALLKRLDAVTAAQVVVPPMRRAVERIKRRMQVYPPPPAAIQGPSSRPVRFRTGAGADVSFVARSRGQYKRTGTYGRRWTTRVWGEARSNVIYGRVGNNTKYAPWVGSQRFQAGIHRNRWGTDEQALRQELPIIQDDFTATIDRALGGKR
jgi:hypothetical protein